MGCLFIFQLFLDYPFQVWLYKEKKFTKNESQNTQWINEWDNVPVRIFSIAGALSVWCVVEEKNTTTEPYQAFVN